MCKVAEFCFYSLKTFGHTLQICQQKDKTKKKSLIKETGRVRGLCSIVKAQDQFLEVCPKTVSQPESLTKLQVIATVFLSEGFKLTFENDQMSNPNPNPLTLTPVSTILA